MDFDDSPEDAAYRATAREWIAANAPDFAGLPAGRDQYGASEHFALAKIWQAKKAAGGYTCINWPTEWGGPGGTTMQQLVYEQEEKRAGAFVSYFMTGLGMCLPVVMQFCDTATRERFLQPSLNGDVVWCQLFSEPSGGSDVAAARTRAVRDGDDWIVNGQKVWTSAGDTADMGLLVTRTNPDVPKHKGLTLFWVDMKSLGVDPRPIKQMSGDKEFCEVYLTDVRIPDSQRVGEINGGWKVILATLMNERASLSGGTGISWPDIAAVAAEIPTEDGTMLDDLAFRERLAEYYVTAEAIRLQAFRTLTSVAKGTTPGPESSMGKIMWVTQTQALTNHALEMQDSYALIDDPAIELAGRVMHRRWLWSPGLRLGGGTDEILRNIIAERLLGLPGDIRVDKDVAFKDIPTGA
jgi:alkylation response protein AidB-like acyl-CoA dehydrogenase